MIEMLLYYVAVTITCSISIFIFKSNSITNTLIMTSTLFLILLLIRKERTNMNFTYYITVVSPKDIAHPYCNIQLPILPRVGDNIILGNESYQVLQVNIQADQIIIQKPDPNVITMSRINTPQEETCIVPVIIICNINSSSDKDDPKS